ncbi:MAG: RNase adapter RapZ [Candidatus Magnetominusculus sp. LBB02]|nr:RNase adapter RapZ [Candidatus Magnetominusculus sp. LBB02]
MKPSLVIVTGLSGAGKTVMLRALEDAGYFCVDNLPSSLIYSFVKLSALRSEKIAVGIDIREKSFLKGIEKVIRKLRDNFSLNLVYLEAETDVVIMRYKETRRPHPLSAAAKGNFEKAIDMEHKMLKFLRDEADSIIDTSYFSPHRLRQHITAAFGGLSADYFKFTIISFGFKFGIPQHLDMLLDVRFLPNPHFVDELRPFTGLFEPVRNYIFNSPVTAEFVTKIEDLMDFLIPLYKKEGKSSFTLGIGCTGGRHRSPAIVERAAEFSKKYDISIEVIHREI